MASKRGWDPNGAEVVANALKCSREKFGYDKIFQGKLYQTDFANKSFNVITYWDVLAIVDNPYD